MAVRIAENMQGTNLIKLKAMQKLEFKLDQQRGFIKYGRDNMYPSELIRLYDEHPEHRAIINRKSRYIAGNGIVALNKEIGRAHV